MLHDILRRYLEEAEIAIAGIKDAYVHSKTILAIPSSRDKLPAMAAGYGCRRNQLSPIYPPVKIASDGFR
jgi:hypothetical protein